MVDFNGADHLLQQFQLLLPLAVGLFNNVAQAQAQRTIVFRIFVQINGNVVLNRTFNFRSARLRRFNLLD